MFSPSAANPVDINIDGAPFFIGDRVEVTNLPTERDSLKSLIRRNGKVVHFLYEGGYGQIYPTDPLVGVQFQGGEIHEFWKEELKNA